MLNKLQKQQIISVHKGTSMGPARAAEGQTWANVLTSPYPEARSRNATNQLLSSPNYRLLSHENNSKKSR